MSSGDFCALFQSPGSISQFSERLVSWLNFTNLLPTFWLIWTDAGPCSYAELYWLPLSIVLLALESRFKWYPCQIASVLLILYNRGENPAYFHFVWHPSEIVSSSTYRILLNIIAAFPCLQYRLASLSTRISFEVMQKTFQFSHLFLLSWYMHTWSQVGTMTYPEIHYNVFKFQKRIIKIRKYFKTSK